MLDATSMGWDGRCEGQRIATPASAIVRVPEGVDYASPSIPFSISGNGGSWRWFAWGELGVALPMSSSLFPMDRRRSSAWSPAYM